MFKTPYVDNNLILFHAIVCHFLVNYTGRMELEKNKIGAGVEAGQKYSFARGILVELPQRQISLSVTIEF